jgi:hypothetical protein
MATIAESATGKTLPWAATDLIDRWIYVFTAGLFLVAVLFGFIPDSIEKITAVRSGQRPLFPPILHVHALLMGSWVILLFAQTTLMAAKRPMLHKQLGMTSFVLAPALVIVGFLLIPTMRLQMADAILHGSPAVAARLKPAFEFTLNIMLVQIRIGLMFAVMIAVGLWRRRRDSALHKRLMILGTAAALPPATDRMLWLPSTLPDNPLTVDLWPLALLAPMFFWDVYRLGKVHKAYLLYLGLSLALAVPMHLLWNTPRWRETALWILGISGI